MNTTTTPLEETISPADAAADDAVRPARLSREFAAAVVVSVLVLAAVYLIFPRADNYLGLKHRLLKHLAAGLCAVAAVWGVAGAARPGAPAASRLWRGVAVPLLALAGFLALGVRLYHPALNEGDRRDHVTFDAGHERLLVRYESVRESAVDTRVVYVAALAAAFAAMIALNRGGRQETSGPGRGAGPAGFVGAALCFAALAAVLNLHMPQAPALAFAEEALEWNAAVALLFAARAGGHPRRPGER